MMEWLEKNWGWMAALAGTMWGGLLYILGIRRELDALIAKQSNDNIARAGEIDRLERLVNAHENKLEHLLEISTRNSEKLDSIYLVVREALKK